MWPQRSHVAIAVLFIDINLFSPINDTYGHEASDYALQKVGGASW